MGRTHLSQPIILAVLLLFIVVGCSAATMAPIPPTATLIPPTVLPVPPIPISTDLDCWTVATAVEPGSPPKLGGTSVQVTFADYAYDGIVGGGGFVIPTGGHIGNVNIGEKAVTLKSHDFGNGSIDTQEFGNMDVLFKANIASECGVLVATSEQLSKLAEWIRSPAASLPPTPFVTGTLVTPPPTWSQTPSGTGVPAQILPPQPLPTRSPIPTIPYYPTQPHMLPPTPGPVEGEYLAVGITLIHDMTFRVIGWQVTDIKLVFLASGNATICKLTLSGSVPIQRDLTFTTEGYYPAEMGIVIKGHLFRDTAEVEWSAQSCGNAGKLAEPAGGEEMLVTTGNLSTPIPHSVTPVPKVQAPSAVSTSAPTTPLPTQEINCTNPLERFTGPGMNAVIRGTQIFTGTANTPDFAFYKVQYMPDASWGTEKWGELYKSTNRVQDGKLFEWQTQTVAPGGYWLRLLVTNSNGNYGEPCIMHVTVTW